MKLPTCLIIPLTVWIISQPGTAGAAPRTTAAEHWISSLLAFPYEDRAPGQPILQLPDALKVSPAPWRGARYPFSFMVDGRRSDELLQGWNSKKGSTASADGVECGWQTWTDPVSGLRVRIETKRFAGFAALEWMLFFENTGAQDSPLIEDIKALDLTLDTPLRGEQPYRLHRSKGAPADPSDFEPATVVVKAGQTETLSAGGGRSSNWDFPFFNLKNAPLVAKLCKILVNLQGFTCAYLQNRIFLPALVPRASGFRSAEPPPGKSCGDDNPWGAAKHYGFRAW